MNLDQLTRVDVIINSKGSEIIITDEEEIKDLRNAFEKIKWEYNVQAEMSRKEDVKATLFITFDKNMPERLVEYLIWFNEGNETATIIDREKSAYGKLDKEHVATLKQIFLN